MKHIYSGKVRDIYDAGDGKLLFVASDRLSVFDVVLGETVPDKGRSAHRDLGVLVRRTRRRAAQPRRRRDVPRHARRVEGPGHTRRVAPTC